MYQENMHSSQVLWRAIGAYRANRIIRWTYIHTNVRVNTKKVIRRGRLAP